MRVEIVDVAEGSFRDHLEFVRRAGAELGESRADHHDTVTSRQLGVPYVAVVIPERFDLAESERFDKLDSLLEAEKQKAEKKMRR